LDGVRRYDLLASEIIRFDIPCLFLAGLCQNCSVYIYWAGGQVKQWITAEIQRCVHYGLKSVIG
jgi:hypothetical protein